MFCGGLGSAFANITSVESNFNILKLEKDDFWQSMMDLTLEGIFQTKQCCILMEMKVAKVFKWEDAKYGALCVMKLNKLEKKYIFATCNCEQSSKSTRSEICKVGMALKLNLQS